MAKLPVLWVQSTGVERIIRVGRRMDSTGVSMAQLSAIQRSKFVEYLPAKRCKTCASWGHASDYERRVECDKYCMQGVGGCPPDGSGFCHNHEEAT